MGLGLLMMNRDLGMNAIRLEGKLQVNEIYKHLVSLLCRSLTKHDHLPRQARDERSEH
jgi:hypothetical protein